MIRAADEVLDAIYRRTYTTSPSPVNGVVYYLSDFDQGPSIAFRSKERGYENFSKERITERVLDDCNDIVAEIHRALGSMLAEHSVYWRSTLWC